MATLSYYALDIGTVTLAIGFILFVIHTTLLASGRRATVSTAAAGAGSGSTATVSIGSGTFSAATPASIGQAFVWVSVVLLGIGLLVRAVLVGRGP